jgi:hypothetical protein
MNQSLFTVADLIAMRDKSVSAAFMNFNHAVVCNPDALFVFYEGQDNDYYYPRLQQYTGRAIEPVKCNGKEKVISIYKILITKPEYDKYRKGFFVDKDFDLNTDPVLSDFYVTSGYSIENFYMTDLCMEETLKQMFNFHTGDTLLRSIVDDYRNMRQNYFDAILLFNTWYCAVKRKYGNVKEDIHLEKEMPRGFVKFDCSTRTVQQQYTMAEIGTMFASAYQYPVTSDEMRDAEAYIRTDMLKNLRGKYCLYFFERYIEYLIELFKNDSTYKNHKRNINIQYNNVMAILTLYAETDTSLISYVTKVAA